MVFNIFSAGVRCRFIDYYFGFLNTKTLEEKWYFYVGAVLLSILFHLIRKNGKKLYKNKNILKINEYGIYGFLESTTEYILWEEIQKIEFGYNVKPFKKYPFYFCFYMDITLKNGYKKLLPYVVSLLVRTQDVTLSNMDKDDVITAVKENFSDKIHQHNIEFNY